MKPCVVASVLLILFFSERTHSYRSELIFVVQKGARDCFYETVDLKIHTGQISFEFEVVDGGERDIEVEVVDTENRSYFVGERRSDGRLNTTLTNSGNLMICFSNEFSIFTSKQVYFELDVHLKKDPHLIEFYSSEVILILDQMEMNLDEAHSHQRHVMGRAFTNYVRATKLNSRVQWAAGIMTLGFLIVSIGQVLILKHFFKDKNKPLRQHAGLASHTVSPPGTMPNNYDTFGSFVVN